jgi:hypothetical protein
MFATELSDVQREINKIVHCQTIDFSGYKITAEGKSQSELWVNVIDAIGVPPDESKMAAISESVATIVMEALKNQAQYDVFYILFTNKNAEPNKKNWIIGGRFKLEEL